MSSCEPRSTEELYQKLRSTENLSGRIECDGSSIQWQVHPDLLLTVSVSEHESYVEVNHGLHHWHPDSEDVYDDLLAIGTKGHMLVIREGLLSSEVFYAGPKDAFRPPSVKGWRRGRLCCYG